MLFGKRINLYICRVPCSQHRLVPRNRSAHWELLPDLVQQRLMFCDSSYQERDVMYLRTNIEGSLSLYIDVTFRWVWTRMFPFLGIVLSFSCLNVLSFVIKSESQSFNLIQHTMSKEYIKHRVLSQLKSSLFQCMEQTHHQNKPKYVPCSFLSSKEIRKPKKYLLLEKWKRNWTYILVGQGLLHNVLCNDHCDVWLLCIDVHRRLVL